MKDRLDRVFEECLRLSEKLKLWRPHRDARWIQEDIDLFDALSRVKHRRDGLRHIKRRSVKMQAVGSFTYEQWQNLVIAYAGRCAYCGILAPNRLTVDHVIPLSKGGSNDIANIKPACKSCNSSKGNRIISRDDTDTKADPK